MAYLAGYLRRPHAQVVLPFTDPLVVPWKFAIDDRGDVVQVADLRYNPLTPDPAEAPEEPAAPAAGQSIIQQALRDGKIKITFTCDPEFRRALDEAIERMNRLASLPAFKITY